MTYTIGMVSQKGGVGKSTLGSSWAECKIGRYAEFVVRSCLQVSFVPRYR